MNIMAKKDSGATELIYYFPQEIDISSNFHRHESSEFIEGKLYKVIGMLYSEKASQMFYAIRFDNVKAPDSMVMFSLGNAKDFSIVNMNDTEQWSIHAHTNPMGWRGHEFNFSVNATAIKNLPEVLASIGDGATIDSSTLATLMHQS